MTKIKFGTDGVRGRANTWPIDPETVFLVGLAAGQVLGTGKEALTGRDSRRSGPMLEAALAAGLASAGVSVRFGGMVPTAALSLAVKSRKADLGIMITASHNPAEDNGVKLFGPDGAKISDQQQMEIERLINAPEQVSRATASKIGDVAVDGTIADIYRNMVRSLTPAKPLAGLKLVVDCAHGSASYLAPDLLAEAGAEVIAIHNQPNGSNINLACGSTYPQTLQAQVMAMGADAGIAFDGDADRLILVDEKGEVIDGDQIMARLASNWLAEGKLREKCVVATVMSNMGLERYLTTLGVKLVRTAVGDRHVSAKMNQLAANLGGEQSGHILLPDYLPTGDGLVAGLMPLLSLARSYDPASVHLRPFVALPQILHNIRHAGDNPLEQPSVQAAIRKAEQALEQTGRVLVRASGTEPLIRVMVEAEQQADAQKAVDQIAGAIIAAG
ncbi:Phosphoglucosamine mutase [hydrothermal vent metagenome]|uniref:Phosphoglucosamine mutase n=1 Tax=hydrothermal vent metagenome TaxID=652676 RepID=A0A3B0R2J6_9ZZZZ